MYNHELFLNFVILKDYCDYLLHVGTKMTTTHYIILITFNFLTLTTDYLIQRVKKILPRRRRKKKKVLHSNVDKDIIEQITINAL